MRRLHWVTLVLTALVGAAGCQDSTGPGGQTSVVRPTEPATLTVTPSTAIVGIGNSVRFGDGASDRRLPDGADRNQLDFLGRGRRQNRDRRDCAGSSASAE